MSHDFMMVDDKGDYLLKPDASGELGCQRCGEWMHICITYNHTPHIQYALRGTPGIEDGYWKWLQGKTGAETAPSLRSAYMRYDALTPPSDEERCACQCDNAYWEECYLPKREEAERSLRKMVMLAEEAPQGRWRCT